MTSLGNTLRNERLRRGLKLEEIVAETKIHLHLLEAIENDQLDRLPGGAYRQSFVRQYAHALSLNEDEAIASCREQFEEPELPLPSAERGHGSTDSWHVWVIATAVACAGIYSLLQDRPAAAPDIDQGASPHGNKRAGRKTNPTAMTQDAPTRPEP